MVEDVAVGLRLACRPPAVPLPPGLPRGTKAGKAGFGPPLYFKQGNCVFAGLRTGDLKSEIEEGLQRRIVRKCARFKRSPAPNWSRHWGPKNSNSISQFPQGGGGRASTRPPPRPWPQGSVSEDAGPGQGPDRPGRRIDGAAQEGRGVKDNARDSSRGQLERAFRVKGGFRQRKSEEYCGQIGWDGIGAELECLLRENVTHQGGWVPSSELGSGTQTTLWEAAWCQATCPKVAPEHTVHMFLSFPVPQFLHLYSSRASEPLSWALCKDLMEMIHPKQCLAPSKGSINTWQLWWCFLWRTELHRERKCLGKASW